MNLLGSEIHLCSSHNGDTEHVAAAQSILNESEWGLMQCPLDVPWSSSDVRSGGHVDGFTPVLESMRLF